MVKVIASLAVVLLPLAARAQVATFAPRRTFVFPALEDQRPGEWGCTEASLDRPTTLPATTMPGMTPIPPLALADDLTDLRIGQPFPRIKPHNLSLASADVP